MKIDISEISFRDKINYEVHFRDGLKFYFVESLGRGREGGGHHKRLENSSRNSPH